MKIPKKIKVAGHNYKVKWEDKRLNKEGLLGQINHIKNTISICKKFHNEMRAKTEIERTLIHEIIHAIDANYNDYGLKDKTVDRLAVGLHQVLKDNFNF